MPCNPSIQRAEAGGLRVWDQPVLHREFQASVGYVGKPCLKKKKKKSDHNEIPLHTQKMAGKTLMM
jgi:hypothetical protein